ncbi:phosphatidylinositol 3-kinase, putative [Trypanosoma equiperdum]|uniref:phosphatidylinositol 3-kinase n=2 Tax=Trypanozoon TaxID=39700 RepID=Q57YM2_TRYB2|nr:phosphatidylinositol 3-kinase, putative [Trypanosoma brucei brucei TREU927]AAX69336.1 phosphatidylinositol 3-kinase, putative [Trypanosoma brucei]AAZ13385.1 phosphatidylinositol 3-kinase, putative [Trypanosoma brucei brucei TREU927]SCU70919.1 phosphatidylinositol 3-kinase, putative [Trypanosoma equiperdum]
MATNEDTVAYTLKEENCGTLRGAPPSNEFLLANDMEEPFMVHLCAVDGYARWCRRRNEETRRRCNGNGGEGEGRNNSSFNSAFTPYGQLVGSMSSLPLRGEAHYPSYSEDDTLCVTLQMFHMGMPITPILQSSHTYGCHQRLEEWIIFPIAIQDIPLDALVHCHVYAPHGLVGRTSFHPFTACGELKTGRRRYELQAGTAAGTERADHDDSDSVNGNKRAPSRMGMNPQELMLRDLRRGLVPQIPWMDKMIKRQVGELQTKNDETTGSQSIALSVLFPSTNGDQRVFLLSAPRDKLPASIVSLIPPPDRVVTSRTSPFAALAATPKQPYVDLCVDDENLCEAKVAALSNPRLFLSSANTQPGPVERAQLKEIAQKPLIHLEELKLGERTLLCRFRHFLTRDPAYFVPFMRSVNWDDKIEKREALKVMQQWKPIGFTQALICLSFYFRKVVDVRIYAINVLDKSSDDRLFRFLIQLVQGVRYDVNGELETFLLRRAANCWEICSNLFWYVLTEASLGSGNSQGDGQRYGDGQEERYTTFLQNIKATLQRTKPCFLQRIHQQVKLMGTLRTLNKSLLKASDRVKRMELATSLIDSKECGIRELFFPSPISSLSEDPRETAAVQGRIVTLPTHPSAVVEDIISEGFYMFKSAMMPIKVPFVLHPEPLGSNTCHRSPVVEDGTNTGPSTVPVTVSRPEGGLLFKVGDDVRQDQLVVQLVQLIDMILRQDGLDLCLCPYRVIATGPTEGLVELIPNVVTLQSVQRDITGFIRSRNQSQEGYTAAMSRFTKSCAGYCVLTFILGIGDRHLENILLTHDGRLLHIDFGYILGNDPKPFPPPMKINKEMVEALGGPQSTGYMEFKSYCCSSYNIIREHAQVILSMLLLMVDASIPHISGDGKVDPRVNLLKVQEKLRLDLSNAEASQYIQNVIADSVGSIFTNLWDVLHAAAQARRA